MPLSPEQRREIEAAIKAENKISAIKLYREATGDGLKEAKDAVEAMERELSGLPPIEKPALKEKQTGKSGCLSVVAILTLLVMAAWLTAHFLKQ